MQYKTDEHTNPQKSADSAGWQCYLDRIEKCLHKQLFRAKRGDYEDIDVLSGELSNFLPEGWEIDVPMSEENLLQLQKILDTHRVLRLTLVSQMAEMSAMLNKIREGKQTLAAYHHHAS